MSLKVGLGVSAPIKATQPKAIMSAFMGTPKAESFLLRDHWGITNDH
jgi:hypothetical protein